MRKKKPLEVKMSGGFLYLCVCKMFFFIVLWVKEETRS
nr:MAG TPA: hypothetical protein [Caudoviricetes sp.]